MKLSREQAQKLLEKLLPDVQVVEDSTTEDLDAITQQLTDKIVDDHKPAIEQAALQTAKQSVAGEMGEMQRKQIMKQFGITDKNLLKDLTFEQMIAKGKEIFAEASKLDVNQHNAKITELTEQMQALQEQHEQALTKANSEWETKFNHRDVTAQWQEILNKLPRKGGDLTQQAKMLHQAAMAEYQVKYNSEKKRNEFFKDNQVALQDGKIMEDVKFAEQWAKDIGILADSTSHINPSTVAGTTQTATTDRAPVNDMYAGIKQYAGA